MAAERDVAVPYGAADKVPQALRHAFGGFTLPYIHVLDAESRDGDGADRAVGEEKAVGQLRVLRRLDFKADFRCARRGSGIRLGSMQEWVPYGIVLGLRTNSRDKSTIIRSAKLAGIDHLFATYINDSNRLDIRPL